MKLLEERIRKDGTVKAGNVLKVDSFLNHQMDIDLFNEMGKEWARLFADRKITKILTVEASGIGIACVAAQHFHVPVVGGFRYRHCLCGSPAFSCTCGICKKVPVRKY